MNRVWFVVTAGCAVGWVILGFAALLGYQAPSFVVAVAFWLAATAMAHEANATWSRR